MIDSASGEVTAPVWAADLTLPVAGAERVGLGLPGRRTSPACRRARSCCMQRGGCGDFTKFLNAQAAGAGAIVYINEGNPAARRRTDPRVVHS